MWNYTEKVMDHFLHPRNVGDMKDPDAVGEVGNITCGDALKLFLKVDETRSRIVDARFETFGCASAIASASALTELVKGRTIEEATQLTNQDIADYLGELPEEKMHCSVMGMEALQAAVANLTTDSGVCEAAAVPDTAAGYDPDGLDRTVCFCFGVTERKIRDVVRANDLTTVEGVTNYTKAGGGCGGCRETIEAILADVRGAAAAAEPQSAALDEPPKLTHFQKILKINETVEQEIRPALKADGGDIEVIDVAGDRVVVRLKGACAGCPGAHVTLKRWVEARLRELVDPNLVVDED